MRRVCEETLPNFDLNTAAHRQPFVYVGNDQRGCINHADQHQLVRMVGGHRAFRHD